MGYSELGQGFGFLGCGECALAVGRLSQATKIIAPGASRCRSVSRLPVSSFRQSPKKVWEESQPETSTLQVVARGWRSIAGLRDLQGGELQTGPPGPCVT